MSPLVELEELEEHKIQTWRDINHSGGELICVEPMASLYDAVRILLGEKIHRLPVLEGETGNPISIVTHKRILHFLYANVGFPGSFKLI